MSDDTLLRIGAVYHLAFAIFHVGFWRLFRWKTELAKLGPINRGVMQILNLRLIYMALVFAFFSWFYADALSTSALGRALVAAIAIFWAMRAVEQIVFFGLKMRVSAAFFAVFVAGAVLYGAVLVA